MCWVSPSGLAKSPQQRFGHLGQMPWAGMGWAFEVHSLRAQGMESCIQNNPREPVFWAPKRS